MAEIIKHYMQKDGESAKDLEIDFEGLKYSKCTGLLDKGKRKNVHIENYADSDTLRVWQGDTVTREATNITFTFFFVGDNRQGTFDMFYNYIKNGRITYWDTKRKKKALLILVDKTEPKEDVYKGSIPYISIDFKFQNLWGECKDVTL